YYVNFPQDGPALKALVCTIFLVETAQTAIVGRDAFVILASGWGNISLLFDLETQWLTAPIMDGLVGGVVQFFYAWRLFALSKSRVLFSVICVVRE
ncbi:hypothetical protein K488DRAFT_47871, partial [Vararia minispora EC-137]